MNMFFCKRRRKKKKDVVASDIVDAENHIPRPPVGKDGRPVRQLKPSQYLSSPYVSVSMVKIIFTIILLLYG